MKLSINNTTKFYVKIENIKIKINLKKNFYSFLFLFIYYFLIIKHSCYNKNKEIRKLNTDSSIEIFIQKNGNQQILYNGFTPKPSKIMINGEVNIINDNYIYDFKGKNNNISIIWNETLKSYSKMFYKLTDITTINLSNLEGNSIKNMSCMFYGCSSLEYIDLTTIDTSSIEDMSYLFYNCSKLAQIINLNNIIKSNTKLMNYIFIIVQN